MSASQRNEWLRRFLWGATAIGAIGVILALSRRPTALITRSPAEELAAAFWRAEAGEPLSSNEKKHLATLISAIPDTAAAQYGLAVAYLLLYGTDELSAPPMVYIQRLQQFRSVPAVMAYLGRLAHHTGQKEKAHAYLRQAIQTDPTCGTAYLFLAQIEPDSACVWLRQGAQATYTPAELTFREKLKAQRGC